jgi:hypothetical protein
MAQRQATMDGEVGWEGAYDSRTTSVIGATGDWCPAGIVGPRLHGRNRMMWFLPCIFLTPFRLEPFAGCSYPLY